MSQPVQLYSHVIISLEKLNIYFHMRKTTKTWFQYVVFIQNTRGISRTRAIKLMFLFRVLRTTVKIDT